MFWIIVGAILFVFIGIPLILRLIISKTFWKLLLWVIAILWCIGFMSSLFSRSSEIWQTGLLGIITALFCSFAMARDFQEWKEMFK